MKIDTLEHVSLTFIGGVEAEISIPPKWDFSIFFGVLGHQYLSFYTPYAGADPIRRVLNLIIASEARAKFLATPLF